MGRFFSLVPNTTFHFDAISIFLSPFFVLLAILFIIIHLLFILIRGLTKVSIPWFYIWMLHSNRQIIWSFIGWQQGRPNARKLYCNSYFLVHRIPPPCFFVQVVLCFVCPRKDLTGSGNCTSLNPERGTGEPRRKPGPVNLCGLLSYSLPVQIFMDYHSHTLGELHSLAQKTPWECSICVKCKTPLRTPKEARY